MLALLLQPLLVILDGVAIDPPKEPAWQVLRLDDKATTDAGVRAIESKLFEAAKPTPFDGSRIYLVGHIQSVLYTISRIPDLWTAAAAKGGDAKVAIDTGKLYAANSQLVPLLWAGEQASPSAAKLKAAGWRMEKRAASDQQILEFLAAQRREPFPAKVDCETGNGAFARCYWITPARFDAARRNDAVPTTRVPPGSGAQLAPGTIKPGDRVVAIGGVPVRDEADYQRILDEAREEKPVAVMVERGRDRKRLDSRIILPKREEAVTLRVQAEYSTESKEILIVSRAVAEWRLIVPEQWAGTAINWNGDAVGKDLKAGCWVVSNSAQPCQ